MTREEALKKVTDRYAEGIDNVKTINKIYDDLESQICENCEWYWEAPYNRKYCKKQHDPWDKGFLDYPDFGKDFGCKKFKLKE